MTDSRPTILWDGIILDVPGTITVEPTPVGSGDRYTLTLDTPSGGADYAWMDVDAETSTITFWGEEDLERLPVRRGDCVRALAEHVAAYRSLVVDVDDPAARRMVAGISSISSADESALRGRMLGAFRERTAAATAGLTGDQLDRVLSRVLSEIEVLCETAGSTAARRGAHR